MTAEALGLLGGGKLSLTILLGVGCRKKKRPSIALPEGDANRGTGRDFLELNFWEAVLGFLVASLPTFGACCLRNKSTGLA